MYEHVKTGCKHIPPREQPLQFQSGYYLNKPRMVYLMVLPVAQAMYGELNDAVSSSYCVWCI